MAKGLHQVCFLSVRRSRNKKTNLPRFVESTDADRRQPGVDGQSGMVVLVFDASLDQLQEEMNRIGALLGAAQFDNLALHPLAQLSKDV